MNDMFILCPIVTTPPTQFFPHISCPPYYTLHAPNFTWFAIEKCYIPRMFLYFTLLQIILILNGIFFLLEQNMEHSL